jgi:hypothetical protein
MSDEGAAVSGMAYVAGYRLLSRAAVEFHAFAGLGSITEGHPGFVSDDYLTAKSAEVQTAVAELELAGMWRRRPGGYIVVDDEMIKTAINFSEQLEAECAKLGRHRLYCQGRRSGSETCPHCGQPLDGIDDGGAVTARPSAARH